MWLEVETKVRISDVVQAINDMRKRVKKIARFEKKEKRGDDYFAIQKKGYPKKAFRIRNKGGVYEINFKKWMKKLWTKDIVVKQEYEFQLGHEKHLDSFLELLKDLGFRQWVKKRKMSESYLYKKDKKVIIEINHVQHLGWFLEIEYLCQRKDLGKARKKIRQVLKELGVKKNDIDNTGYTKMLFKRGIMDRKFFLK